MLGSTDALTADLETKTQAFISLVEEDKSPIKNSLSDVPQLRDAYYELRNIARALDQYARTNRGLRYIGLMGTFSSGKSSVINSLIGQTVRAADLPPVDNEITIITHPSNRDALMGAHSRGLLKVTTQPVDAELLNSCFLVDTPGSGDPEVREGMVKDFLPICDLILYVFSATSALSVPDLSVLRTLQDNLDFVPIRFVITRSDEFRRNHNAMLTIDNLDQDRLDGFLAHLISRIRAQAPRLDLSPDRFFFIDNRAQFGIDNFKRSIMLELESDVQLHSKKISYFRRGISTQKATFEAYLFKLIEDVTQLESKAKLNKEHYEDNVVLSFQSINDFWRPREGAQTTRVSQFEKLAASWEVMRARQATDSGAKGAPSARLRMVIVQRTKEFCEDLRRHLTDIAREELYQRREEFDLILPTLIRERGTISANFSRPAAVTRITTALAPNVLRAFRVIADAARSDLFSALRDANRVDKEVFDAIFEHARRGDLTAKDNDYYRDFEAMVRADLRKFLPIVALFRSAVTSTQARNLIARTGLGEKLDVLDNVDVDTAAANDHADALLRNVFATRDVVRRTANNSATALLERKDLVDSALEELRSRISEGTLVRLDFADLNALDLETNQLLSPLLDRMMVALEAEIVAAHSVWNDSLKEAQESFAANLRTDRSQVLFGWYHRFSAIVGVATFLGVLSVAALFATGLQSQIGWALTIFSGALTTVTAWVFGWGWERVSTKGSLIPKSRRRVADEVAAKSMPHLQTINIEESGQFAKAIAKAEEDFVAAVDTVLANDRSRLLTRYSAIADSERALIEGETEHVTNYFKSWKNLANGMNDWYQPDELKKKLISDAASAIRERAIEPALTLFAERLRDVQDFYGRLRSLSF